MTALVVYGIANCDSVKACRKWLESQGITYHFHDFRKDGLTRAMVRRWIVAGVKDRLLNRRGTTWRKLDAQIQARAENDLAALLVAHPTLIKRPVIEFDGTVLVGFTDAEKKRLGALK